MGRDLWAASERTDERLVVKQIGAGSGQTDGKAHKMHTYTQGPQVRVCPLLRARVAKLLE